MLSIYKQRRLDPEDEANERATQLMCDLHDALEDGGHGIDAGGEAGHELKRLLVRILFCLFADDTGIFPPDAFKLYLLDRTAPDGSDLGARLVHLFQILDTPEDRRQKNLDEDLRQFPYINGDLFAEHLPIPDCTSVMRDKLLACARFHWSRISPAVFGSLFQSVMDARERRQIGAHYTAERNILKVVRSLFLDDLRAEFTAARSDRSGRGPGRLRELQKKLAALRFLDPACGCGNFLVVTYRELRQLELDILIELRGTQQESTLDEVNRLSQLDVDQMYGIEFEEFPARIAEVALWLTDHQMNVRLSEAFGPFYLRIPLRKSPHIHVANALRLDWRTVLNPDQCSYVLGNPPFVGKKEQSAEQKSDMDEVWGKTTGTGILDYVTCWYRLAADYITGTPIRVAFVSTNSISQGEQVSVLWGSLLARHKLKIHFAHRTFAWESEARGRAQVHVVIIGFGLGDVPQKRIYDYDVDPLNPTVSAVRNISPYLIEGGDTVVTSRRRTICQVPEMIYGSFALDDGNYTLSHEDRAKLLQECPKAVKYLRPFIGGQELLHGKKRYCLWLQDADPSELRKLPAIMKRVDAVRTWRSGRGRETTRELADTPTRFAEVRQPHTPYLAIPTLSSERRRYIPIAFLDPETIASNQVYILPDATLYHFGILHSAMHMSWVKQVCGRLESRYRYSNNIVYNNHPWPETHTPAQRAEIETAAQAVLDARATFRTSTLADLYDPLSMPPKLAQAHATLDRAVDRSYRKEPFPNDRARVEYLFTLYERLTAPLVSPPKPKRSTSRRV